MSRLPTELRQHLTGDIAELLDAQWNEMQQRRHVIASMATAITSLRLELDRADINTPERPTFSDLSDSSSIASRDEPFASDDDEYRVFRDNIMPVPLCPLPTRQAYDKTAFPWHSPLPTWSLDEQDDFFHVRKNAVLRKLWRSYAAVNNIYAWTGVNPSVGTDLRTFLVEARSLFLDLHANAGDYTYTALPGGWGIFLSTR